MDKAIVMRHTVSQRNVKVYKSMRRSRDKQSSIVEGTSSIYTHARITTALGDGQYIEKSQYVKETQAFDIQSNPHSASPKLPTVSEVRIATSHANDLRLCLRRLFVLKPSRAGNSRILRLPLPQGVSRLPRDRFLASAFTFSNTLIGLLASSAYRRAGETQSRP